jgi:hypothetical protein
MPETQSSVDYRAAFVEVSMQLDQALRALKALTMWSVNGEQLCFRTANSIPMGMSKRQERLAREALGD